jgi:hypothetical protein
MPASRTLLAFAAIGVASLAFAGGLAASSATVAAPPGPPIVNVNAWEETAPASAVQAVAVRLASLEPTLQSTHQCNPWDVSDLAMEEILREMKRQGWRPPSQGGAVASMISIGAQAIAVVDPDAPTPTESSGRSKITVLTDEEAEQLRTKQILLQQLITDEPAVRSPS